MFACQKGHLVITRKLVAMGLSVNKSDQVPIQTLEKFKCLH